MYVWTNTLRLHSFEKILEKKSGTQCSYTRMLLGNDKNIRIWTNKQELSCLNTLNFYGSLRQQLCLSRSNIEVNKLRYFVFNWIMNVKLDWLEDILECSIAYCPIAQSHTCNPTPLLFLGTTVCSINKCSKVM